MNVTGSRPCPVITPAGRSCPNLLPCPDHPPRTSWSARDREAQRRARTQALERTGHRCERCGRHDPSGRGLQAHHHGAGDAVRILCRECHRQVDHWAR